MNKISFVALNRAEGPTKECGAVVFYTTQTPPVVMDPNFKNAKFVKTENIKDAVLRQFYVWGLTAPFNGGYDKTDFQVNWFGGIGYSYSGRFDMEGGGTDGYGDFWASLKNRLEIYSFRKRLERMPENRLNILKKAIGQNSVLFGKILDDCEL